MPLATAIQLQASTCRNRSTASDRLQLRRRALARLYERRAAVDQLIGSLERYREWQRQTRAECVSITAEAMS
jgi:hypothetical protein